MNEDWLHKVRDRMMNYETDEPAHLWDEIEARLPETTSGLRSRRWYALPIWVRRGAAAVVVAVFGAMVVYMARVRPDMSEAQLPSTASRMHAPAGALDRAIAEAPAHESDNPVFASRALPAVVSSAHKEMSHPRADEAVVAEVDGMSSAENTADDAGAQSVRTDSMPEPFMDDGNCTPQPALHANNANTQPQWRKKSRTDRFSLALYSSGASTGVPEKGHDDLVSSPGDNLESPGDSDVKSLRSRKESEGENVKHHIPIRAGVLFAYHINNRLSIESGVSYAHLSSTATGGTPRDHYEREQTLQYIGVPLNLKYRLFSWKRLSLYASAGVLGEKCFSAKTSTTRVHNNFTTHSGTRNLSDKPMQWSVNASVGAQCRLLGAVSLFVEPGLGYYFDSGSAIHTVYTDSPLNFNLNMGLRFSFGE